MSTALSELATDAFVNNIVVSWSLGIVTISSNTLSIPVIFN